MEFAFGIRACLHVSSTFVFVFRRLRRAIASEVFFDIFAMVCFSTRHCVGDVRVDEKFAAVAGCFFGERDFCGCVLSDVFCNNAYSVLVFERAERLHS